MIRITSFARPKENKNTSTSNTGFSNTITYNNNAFNTHLIFGHEFNGTQDVEGELNNVTDINASGDINATNGTFTGDVDALNISATNGAIDNLTSDNINTANITAEYTYFDNLEAVNCQADNMTVEDLTVTGNARFWSLVIDKMKSTEGAFILSPANCTIEKISDNKLCWRTSELNTNKAVSNDFVVGDQILCLTFNKAVKSGQNYNVSNKYYWGLVTSKGIISLYDDLRKDTCDWHYIELSSIDYDGTLNYEVGDNLCVLGNRNDTSRQNAIIMSSTNSTFLDETSIQAPSIVQYKGINTFNLAQYRYNTIAANGNVFYGDFMVSNGGTNVDVLDLINDSKSNIAQIEPDSMVTLIMADANSQIDNINAAVGLVKKIEVYLGNTLIPTSEIDSTSYVQWRNQKWYIPDTSSHIYMEGITIKSITKNPYDVAIAYKYNSVAITHSMITTASDTEFVAYVKFTHDNITYEKMITVPAKVVQTQSGADAEFDMMFVENLSATVTIEDKLKINGTVYVYHCVGQNISQVTSLSDYNLNMISNAGDTITFNKSSNGWFYYNNNAYIADYSEQQNKQTVYTLRLYKSGNKIDQQILTVTFDSGSVFQVGQNAITSAVAQSNGYTDTNISRVEQTANGISSRVTSIENDYITSTVLNQTANQIELNVYDELNQQTGINVTTGTITLNANNTYINGNLNLYDSNNNGITIYDDYDIERVNIQSDSIGNISQMANDTRQTIINSSTTTGTTNYNITTNEQTIGNLNANTSINISRFNCFLSANSSSYPTQSTAILKIEILNGSTVTYTAQLTINKVDNNGRYENNVNTINVPVSTSGVYTIRYTFMGFTPTLSSASVYGEVIALIQCAETVQTYIGRDGMYSHVGADKLLWINEDELQLRYGFTGIRMKMKDPSAISGDLETITGTNGTNPIWLPFYNYTPTFHPFTFNNGTITNTGQTNKYYYQIDPQVNYGLCICDTYATNNNSPQETWIILPPSTFIQDGVQCSLPIGYTMTIIKNFTGANLYVAPHATGQHQSVIIDANMNSNYYVAMNANNQTRDTFIYVGSNTWISKLDH